jgi:hypothetical protein
MLTAAQHDARAGRDLLAVTVADQPIDAGQQAKPSTKT